MISDHKKYAMQMQQLMATHPGNTDFNNPIHFILAARWWYWSSKYSMNPAESLRFAKSQYRLARDMQANPDYYRKKPADISHWLWFMRKAGQP